MSPSIFHIKAMTQSVPYFYIIKCTRLTMCWCTTNMPKSELKLIWTPPKILLQRLNYKCTNYTCKWMCRILYNSILVILFAILSSLPLYFSLLQWLYFWHPNSRAVFLQPHIEYGRKRVFHTKGRIFALKIEYTQ